MNSRKTISLIIVVVGLAGAFVLYSYLKQNQAEIVPRPKIDPASFTREEALASLTQLESKSSLSFSSSERKRVDESAIPEELKTLVILGGNEEAVFEQDALGLEIYYINYKSGLALPDSHTYLIKAAGRNGFTFSRGARNDLAGSFEAVSANYEVRVSQIAVSEERTEVFVYAKRK